MVARCGAIEEATRRAFFGHLFRCSWSRCDDDATPPRSFLLTSLDEVGGCESPQTCKGHPSWVCCQLAVLCTHSLWPNQPLSCFAYGHPAFAQIIGARTEEIKSYTNSHRQLLPWLAARQPCAAPLLARPPGDARRRALLPREPRALPTNGPSESRCRPCRKPPQCTAPHLHGGQLRRRRVRGLRRRCARRLQPQTCLTPELRCLHGRMLR